MESVKSDNVVTLLDVMESSKNYYIVQELCDTNLLSLMKPGSIIPEDKAKDYLLQITNGFLALVREGIIHRYSWLHPATSSPPTS
jgi:serine/threonine protein kinase